MLLREASEPLIYDLSNFAQLKGLRQTGLTLSYSFHPVQASVVIFRQVKNLITYITTTEGQFSLQQSRATAITICLMQIPFHI